jgi:Flp pilus assembly pilin Flp
MPQLLRLEVARQMDTRVHLRFRCRWIWSDKSGAVATEYAFVIAFISILGAFGMVAMGSGLSSFYNTVGGAITTLGCEMPETASDNGKSNSNRCK